MGSLSAERSYQEHQSVVRRLGLSPKMNSADESSAQDFEEMDLIRASHRVCSTPQLSARVADKTKGER